MKDSSRTPLLSLALVLLLAGCTDYDTFAAVCEERGGQSYWLRGERPLCVKSDAVIDIKKTRAGYK